MPDTQNGRDWTSLKAWASAIGVVGIPGAIAIGLVWVGAMEIPKLVRSSESSVTELRDTKQELKEINNKLDRLIRKMELDCFRRERDENAKQRCFDP